MKTETKKVLLFDVYQTLVDIDISQENRKNNKTRAWDNMAKSLKEYGLTITSAELIRLVDQKRAEFYQNKDKKIYHHNFFNIVSKLLKDDLGVKITQKEIHSLIYNYHKISSGHARLYPGVIETLSQLKQKYILSVASYTQSSFTKSELEDLGIAKFFSYFIFTSDIGFHKASPEFYKHCLKVVGEKAENCLMIGDNYDADVMVPRELGMKTIWVRNPLTVHQYSKLFNEKLDNIVDLKNLNKLTKIVDSLFE